MPIASYQDHENNQSYFEDKSGKQVSIGKALARVYGYMAIGILVTALVAFFTAWLFSSHIKNVDSLKTQNSWVIAYLVSLVVSGILVIILSFALPVAMARGKHSIWPYFILYAVAIGVLFTAFLLAGISWYIIGEALAITSASFLAMFLIGWFSSAKFHAAAYVAIMILSMVLLFGLIFFIVFAIHGFTWQQYMAWNLAVSGIIVLITLISVALDSFRIRKTLEKGAANDNVYLYCAYCMYTNFVVLLFRIIYILALSQRRN